MYSDLASMFHRWGLTVRAQGSRPTCSVFALAGAIEFARASVEGRGLHLSVDFLNWGVRQVTGRNEDGGLFSEIWEAYQRFGACREETLPYGTGAARDFTPPAPGLEEARQLRDLDLELHWIKDWDITTGLTAAQVGAIEGSLQRGVPVCGGFRWPRKQVWIDGTLQMCGADDVYDGHSVLLYGYCRDTLSPGEGTFLVRNSGGDSRLGALTYEYARAYMNDAAWIGRKGTTERAC
jgi:hypothetical protein